MTQQTLPQPALFADVRDHDDSDRECMTAAAEVLARHGKLDRFDLALAHRHFGLGDGEVPD